MADTAKIQYVVPLAAPTLHYLLLNHVISVEGILTDQYPLFAENCSISPKMSSRMSPIFPAFHLHFVVPSPMKLLP